MPAFSSGQWAGTLPMTYAATRSPDFLFLCGGGIIAHPDGPSAGVASLLAAWEAVKNGEALGARDARVPELKRALRVLRQARRIARWSPRIAYYGDDFTGATDTLATATQGGLRTLLFLRVPTPQMLARRGRSRLRRHRRRVALDDAGRHGDASCARWRSASRALGAPVMHYKTCSTFDSSPAIGNIAVAMRVLSERIPGRFIPIVGGQPNIGRYCAFGHLFAAAEAGGPVLRIDRHPMSRHPVTPMTESDLRLHLERQGLRPIRSVPYPSYELAPDALDRTCRTGGRWRKRRPVRRDRGPADLAPIGRVIWREAKQHRLVAAGPSGVTQALCAHWHEVRRVAGRRDLPRSPRPTARCS